VRILLDVEGGAAAIDVRFDGKTHDGRHVSFEAVDLFDIADGRIARIRSFYDLLLVRSLLEPPRS
jgi:ketosteroid isomerase-like protein